MRGLLTFLCTKLRTQPGSSQATLEQVLTTNATISEHVRRRALEWAPEFWKASAAKSPQDGRPRPSLISRDIDRRNQKRSAEGGQPTA